MSAKTATITNLPTIDITCSKTEQLNQKSTKFYNDSSIIKSGILELCHLVQHSANGHTIKELVGEKVLVTIYRTCGEYFTVINFCDNSSATIQCVNELNPNSICVNLKHCKVEKCSNSKFFKLVLNDFTSVILFRVVKQKETHLQAPTMNNQQSKSLGDLSVINEIDNENDNQKNNQDDQTLSWINAFSENTSNQSEYLRVNNLNQLTRRQSLQTVLESDEEDEEQCHSIQ